MYIKKSLAGMAFVLSGVLCLCTKLPVTASEDSSVQAESSVSEETYNQMIKEQMENTLGTADGEVLDLADIEPLSVMMNVTKKANIRSGPDTAFDSLGILEAGTEIMVSGITPNDWYQTSYQGKVGYVLSDYLQEKEMAEGLSQEMAEQIENVVDAVEADVVAIALEESMAQTAAQEKSVPNEDAGKEDKSDFTFWVFGVLVVLGGGLFLVNMIGQKEPDQKKEKAEFDIEGMETVKLDEEDK